MLRRVFNGSIYQYFDFTMNRYHWLKGISYDKQYETRDFIKRGQREIINYCDTEAFRNYKPNLKQIFNDKN